MRITIEKLQGGLHKFPNDPKKGRRREQKTLKRRVLPIRSHSIHKQQIFLFPFLTPNSPKDEKSSQVGETKLLSLSQISLHLCLSYGDTQSGSNRHFHEYHRRFRRRRRPKTRGDSIFSSRFMFLFS